MDLGSFYSGRRCVVTGCGFVGSHLVDALLAAGATVRVVSRSGRVPRDNPALDAVAADLTRIDECLSALKGADSVFHAAGSVGAAGVGPAAAMAGIALNLTLTANVVQAAWQQGVGRLLLFSSSTAYPAATHPVREDELWEGPVFPGYHGYGWMRRYVERLGEFAAAGSGVGVSIVRPGALYGPRDNFDPRTSHVIAGMIQRAVKGEAPFLVWGTGEEVRDILHVRDFARGCLLALAHKADCSPVNLGSGRGTTTRELASLVLKAAGSSADEIVFDPTKPSAMPYRVLDGTKAERELGFVPEISLEDGLAEVVEWYRGFHAGA